MSADITTEKKLPMEYLDFLEEKRNKLEIKEKVIIQEDWKAFTPGILYLDYGKSDIDKGDDFVSMNYDSQLLYGHFDINTSWRDNDFEVDNFNWERSTISDRKVSLGDGYIRSDFNIGDSSSFRGISILKRNSWDTQLDVTTKSVEGIAPNGVVVELYENGLLREYQISRGGTYSFSIDTTGGSKNYEVWIYMPDGSIKKESLAIYGNNDLVDKGEFDIEIQGGVERDYTDYKPYAYSLYYGFTEDLTLKLGGFNSRSDEDERDYYSLSPVYRFNIGSSQWSHLFSGNYASNSSDSEENFYKARVESNKNNIYNIFEYTNYKDLNRDHLNESYDEKFLWRNNFSVFGINTSLSYEYEIDNIEDEKLDRYGLTLYESFMQSKISTSVSLTREQNDIRGNKTSHNEVGLGVNYHFRNEPISRFINTIGADFDGSNEESSNYRVFLQKNSRNSNLDYYLSFQKKDGDSRYELSITYKFGDKFQLRSSSSKNQGRSVTAIEAQTAINFGNPDKKFNYPDSLGDSNVEGTFFYDKNNNGVLDKNETGMKGFKLQTSDYEVISGEEGTYFLPLLHSSFDYKLNLTNESTDINYHVSPAYNIRTRPGGQLKLDIPVKLIKTVIGIVDFKGGFYLEEVRDILSNSKILIKSLDTYEEISIPLKNEYFIYNLPVGKYAVDLSYDGNTSINLEDSDNFLIISTDDEDSSEEYIELVIEKKDDINYEFQLVKSK